MLGTRHTMIALAATAALVAAVASAPEASGQTTFAKNQARSHHQQGRAAMSKKDYVEAVSRFARAVSIHPTLQHRTALCVARVLELKHAKRPENTMFATLDRCQLAVAASNGKPSAKLLAHIKIARRIQADLKADRLARNAAGRARSGFYDAAESQLRAAIKLSDKPAYHYELCGVLEHKRKYAAAIASCTTAAAAGGPSRAPAKARIAKIRRLVAGGTVSPQAVAALQAASQAERAASFVKPQAVGSGSRLDVALRTTKACVAAVDAAAKVGVPLTAETRVDNSKVYKHGRRTKKPGHTANDFAPLSEIRTRCQAKLDRLSVLPAKRAVEEVFMYIEALERNKNPGSHGWLPVKMAYDKCLSEVKRSLALGASPSTAFTVKSVSLTLGTASAKGCGVALPVVAKARGVVSSGKAAKFAPYKRVLGGDKWRTFIKHKMINFRVYGPGGRELSTPRKLARASVWFEHLHSGSHRRWAMRRFKFNRRNRLVSERRLTGRGKNPPSRAYR